MRVVVRGIDGPSVALDNMQPSDTVMRVLQMMQDKDGIPPDQVRVVFRGAELTDTSMTLAQYNIHDNDTVHLVLRVRKTEAD
ncbi:hypothetical protein Pelo_19670 [Pelomyxa schiedti]|nr:hypothetical protein Pelo_19670 [Pelomyxa schiedti]